MSTVEILVLGILFVIVIGFQITIFKRLKPEEIEDTSIDYNNQFSEIASSALSKNNEQFLQLADERFKRQQSNASNELESRKKEIETLIQPLSEQIKKLEDENKLMEKARYEAYGDLKNHVTQMIQGAEKLGMQASNLTTALTKSANVRGNWGEVSLDNILEMSGLRKGIDYVEQATQSDGKRPDFIINIPGGGKVPIDAKATGKKFLESIEEADDVTRIELLKEHAAAMKGRVNELKSKGYRDSVDGDVEVVVMFVPSESLLAITFDFERDLHEFAMKNGILIASPVSILALLRTIAFQWRQVEQAENTREAVEICRELYKRFAVWSEHYKKVGDNLSKAIDTFNKSVGSYQQKINPQVRKLNDIRLNEDLQKQIVEPSTIDTDTRALPEPEDYNDSEE
ncbi:MAG: DNA recombination protein RmuC [Candidatus Poseidoniales archaeon]|nr:MAG: DNA recombination protein RmuC [Candidatus Poseidoniales archaeon]|tara:strand:- start:3932 stop:5131 length:1200 start_codon:yes stop_codon:yes gene_type:complete